MRSWKRVLLIYMAVLCLAVMIPPAVAEETVPVVRVAYYQSDSFQEGTSDAEPKSGYSYDYLQKISYYTGWRYEYVYGDWSELYDLFLAGDVDLMAGMSRTEEREDKMLFPDQAMGSERYYIYVHEDDTSLDSGDTTGLVGKKIGGVINNLMTATLEEWIEEHAFGAQIVYYDGFADRDADFYAGKIDGVVGTDNNIAADSGMKPFTQIGESPYYLAVANGREDLLAQIDAALARLEVTEPYLLQNLQSENFGSTAVGKTITENENEWLSKHDTLKIGYVSDYLPFCGTDADGDVTGVLKDIMTEVVNVLSLEDSRRLEYTEFVDQTEMFRALESGEIDVVFPIYANGWLCEQNGLFRSNTVISVNADLVYSGNYSEDCLKKIAVYGNNLLMTQYVTEQYPDAEIITCDSIGACVDAVITGKAGCTLLNCMRTQQLLSGDESRNLHWLTLPVSVPLAFGVKLGNAGLLSLINHGLSMMETDYAFINIYKYQSVNRSYTLMGILREYALPVILIVVLAATLVILIMFRFYRKARKAEVVSRDALRKMLEAQSETVIAREAAERAVTREKTLQQVSYTDALTGVQNRRAYEDAVLRMVTADTVGVFFCDVNGLKQANDNFGHEAGDKLLVRFADLLRECFRESDLYRLGGDEFVVLMPHIPHTLFDTKAENISGSLARNDQIASVGGAFGRGAEIAGLIKTAEGRMYEEKRRYHAANP